MNTLSVVSRLFGALVFSMAISACGDDSSGGGGGDVDAGNVDVDAGATADCSVCATDATCDDSASTAVCECPAGFEGDGTSAGTACTDIDECATSADDCLAEATCTNTDSSFTCECPTGFMGDGVAMCMDIDECADMVDGCVAPADGGSCTNETGTFTCACQEFFAGDGTVAGTGCVEDKCASGNNNCDPLAICTATLDTFTCECPAGFDGDGTTCTNLDECALGTDTCGLADCTDQVGGFTCQNIIMGSVYTGEISIVNSVPYLAGLLDDVATPELCDGGGIRAQLTLREVGAPGVAINGSNGLAREPGTGVLYIVYKTVEGRILGTLNPASGDVTRIGVLGDRISSLSFDGSGNLFGTIGQGGTVGDSFVAIDKATAALTVLVGLPNGSDGTIAGFNEVDGFFYHLGGRDTSPGADLIDVSVDLTDPLNPVFAATTTTVTRAGFNFDEPFGMLFGWPTPGTFGLSNLDQELLEVTTDSTNLMAPSLNAVQQIALNSNCNPGPSTDTGTTFYVRGMAFADITPQPLGGACTGILECTAGNVCDTVGSDQCEAADTCGNGALEGTEECDDGNVLDGDGCQMDCVIVLLADGVACTDSAQCINVCDTLDSNQCEPADTCGNGNVEGVEACDDGNVLNGDGCEMDCTITLLADGVACTDSAQCINVCDTLDSNQCEPVDTCGNGNVEGMEVCDDGNVLDGDGCEMDCTPSP